MAMKTEKAQSKKPSLTGNMDIGISIGIIGILMVMIIPLPTAVLDILLAMNISLSIMIILVTIYVVKPLDFSVFPSLLLLTTLFRLALNIASTRLILLNGNTGLLAAGKVIKGFGSFVVGGNPTVGLVVFVILVVINFVVITKGSGRIAEVAARFGIRREREPRMNHLPQPANLVGQQEGGRTATPVQLDDVAAAVEGSRLHG